MSFFEKNLEKIREYNPVLAKKLVNHTVSSNFEFINSSSGDINLKCNGILIHDIENPQKEAQSVFNQVKNTSEYSISIIIGLGLGYLLKRFCLSSKGKIVLYEPNLDILRFTLDVADLSAELNQNRVFVANTYQELIKFLDENYIYKDYIGIFGLASCHSLYPNEVKNLQQNLAELESHLESNYIGLFERSFEWLMQGISNLPEFSNSYNIDSLRNKFKNKPAVIVSSGPSLDKTAPILARNRDKVIIYSAGSAYKALAKHDIKPDFITFIEAYKHIACQVKDMDTSDINFINLSIAHNSLFNLKSKRNFIFYTKNDLFAKWLAEVADFSIDDYITKGSVSYCALYSAYMMGCNPIILVGQDLAYTDGKCYSSDSSLGTLILEKDESTGKFKVNVTDKDDFAKHFVEGEQAFPIEEIIKQRLEAMSDKLTYVNGQNGEKLLSEVNYASFIHYFEQFAYESSHLSPDLKLINSSVGGAQINGFKNLELASVLSNFSSLNEDTELIIQSSLNNYIEPIKEKINIICENLWNYRRLVYSFRLRSEKSQILASNLSRELSKKQLNLNEIKRLVNLVFEDYIDFKDNLFAKNQMFSIIAFKELLEFTKIMDDEQSLSSLDGLKNLARISTNFYSAYYVSAGIFTRKIEHIIKILDYEAY